MLSEEMKTIEKDSKPAGREWFKMWFPYIIESVNTDLDRYKSSLIIETIDDFDNMFDELKEKTDEFLKFLRLKYKFLYKNNDELNFIMTFIILNPVTTIPYCIRNYCLDYQSENNWNLRNRFYTIFDKLLDLGLLSLENYEYKTNSSIRLYSAIFSVDFDKERAVKLLSGKQRPKGKSKEWQERAEEKKQEAEYLQNYFKDKKALKDKNNTISQKSIKELCQLALTDNKIIYSNYECKIHGISIKECDNCRELLRQTYS